MRLKPSEHERVHRGSAKDLTFLIEADTLHVNETSEDVFGEIVINYLKDKSSAKFQDLLKEMVRYLHINLEDFDDK